MCEQRMVGLLKYFTLTYNYVASSCLLNTDGASVPSQGILLVIKVRNKEMYS